MDSTESEVSTFACHLRQMFELGLCGGQPTICSNTVHSDFECLDRSSVAPDFVSFATDLSGAGYFCLHGLLSSCNKHHPDSCLPVSCRSSRPAQMHWLQGQQCLAPRTTQKVS